VVGLLAFAGCILVSGLALGQTITVTPNRQSLPLGETVVLDIVLEGSFDSTRGPEMPDFEIVGRSSGSSITVVQGVVRQEQRVTLTLAPRRAGNLTIGAIQLVAAGKVVARSRPVAIRVTPAGTPAPAPEPEPKQAPDTPDPPPVVEESEAPVQALGPAGSVPEKFAGRQAFALARAPDRTVYNGEPIYVEYVLYTRADLPLSGFRVDEAPKLKGFVVLQSRTDEDRVARVRIRNAQYEARVVWRGAVSSLGPGPATLDPIRISLYVGDFFGRRRVAVASEPVSLDFMDVPSDGKPADWVAGTIGSFAVQATLDQGSIRVGETALLNVVITGSGNLRAVRAPVFEPVDGLRITRIPTSDLDETVIDVGGVSGRRTFQYLIRPEQAGTFDVGRVDLPYFNPMSGRFERARTDPLRILASGSGGPSREAGERGEAVVAIIERSALTEPEDGQSTRLPIAWVFIGMSLPVVFFLGAEVVVRRRLYREANHDGLARMRASRDIRNVLERLGRSSTDPQTFWSVLDDALRRYLAVRFSVPATPTRDEVQRTLLACGAAPTTVAAILDELEACAFARFAPSAAQDRDRTGTLERIRNCLNDLDRVRSGDGGTC
jgi:hypothetical protein